MHDVEITQITPLPQWRLVQFKVETEVGQELCCYIAGRELDMNADEPDAFLDAFEGRRAEIQSVIRMEINTLLDQCPDDYTDPDCSHPLRISLPEPRQALA